MPVLNSIPVRIARRPKGRFTAPCSPLAAALRDRKNLGSGRTLQWTLGQLLTSTWGLSGSDECVHPRGPSPAPRLAYSWCSINAHCLGSCGNTTKRDSLRRDQGPGQRQNVSEQPDMGRDTGLRHLSVRKTSDPRRACLECVAADTPALLPETSISHHQPGVGRLLPVCPRCLQIKAHERSFIHPACV